MDLVEEIYKLTAMFPSEERYGLTSQVRRAAVSVPSNIAEGYGRKDRGDHVRRLSIANGSLKELETQLIIAGRLKHVTREQCKKSWSLAQSTGKMLKSLMNSLTS
jgi:four helix bundle protein